MADLANIARAALGIDPIEAVQGRFGGNEGGGLPLVMEAGEEDEEGEDEGLGYTGPDPCHRGRVTGEDTMVAARA